MKLRGAAAFLVLTAVTGLAPPAPGGEVDPADRQDEIASELDRLRSKYDEVEAEEADLLSQYELSQRRARQLAARVAELDAQLTATAAELRKARARLRAIEARRREVRRRARAVRAEHDEARHLLQEQAVAAYMGTADGNRLSALLLRAEDARQVLLATAYATAVAERQQDLIERLDALVEDLGALERRLARAEDGAQETRDDIARRVTSLRETRQAQAAARAEVAAEAARQADLLDQVRRRMGDYERRIAELQQESDSIAELLRARQAGQGIIPSGNGVLAVPISGGVISSGFGPRLHPIFQTVRTHTGVDFSAASGTPIRAAAAGEVVWAAWRGGYGLATVIDHGGSLATLYAHQSATAVSVGSTVSRGEVIGYVGSTGFSTGPHLHFEVRVNGTPVDPLAYI